MIDHGEKSESFQFVIEDAESSTVQARWSFSTGGGDELPKLDDDDFWEAVSTVPTSSVDSDGEFSLGSQDDIAEEVPPSPPHLMPSPPASPPTKRDLMIQGCHKNFCKLSQTTKSGGKPRISTIASPVMPYRSPRPSLRNKEHQRKTRSLRDRSAIRESLKSVMAFDD